MKIKLLAFMSALTIMLMISGCSKTNGNVIPAGYTSYTDEARLFTISYPQVWSIDSAVLKSDAVIAVINSVKKGETNYQGTSLFFAGLASANGYRPNFTVSVSPVPSGYTYDSTLAYEMDALKRSMSSYRQFSMTDITVSGRRATLIDCEGSFDASANIKVGVVHDLYMYTVVGKNYWLIACTSFDNSFSLWSADFNNIVRSLTVTA